MPGAWDYAKGNGARICVIDGGWDRSHHDLTQQVVAERDVVGSGTTDDVASDNAGHGTFVAGIAAADTDNNTHTAGVAWTGLLVIAKAADSNGLFYADDLLQAFRYCGNVAGVSVVNASLSGYGFNDSINAEVQELVLNGKTVVAAAGNDGPTETRVPYPAGYQNVIGVGATSKDGTVAHFSQRGSYVDLVAPGDELLSLWINDGLHWEVNGGTSFSSPQVAGAAAILYGQGFNKDQVRARLFQYATDRGAVGKDAAYGHGFLNVRCAVVPNTTGC